VKPLLLVLLLLHPFILFIVQKPSCSWAYFAGNHFVDSVNQKARSLKPFKDQRCNLLAIFFCMNIEYQEICVLNHEISGTGNNTPKPQHHGVKKANLKAKVRLA